MSLYTTRYDHQGQLISDVFDIPPNPYGDPRRCACGKKLSFYNHEIDCFSCQRRLEARKPLRTDVKLHSKPHKSPENVPRLSELLTERDPPILP